MLDVDELRLRFRAWHHSDERLNNQKIDDLLGIRSRRIESHLNLVKLLHQLGNEQLSYDGSSYESIRNLFRYFELGPSNVFYDLGAGYGRVLFYGALVKSAKFRGIEIVPQRVKEANRIRERFGLTNIEFKQGDACDVDFSDGDCFFFYNPFFRDTLRCVGSRLRELSLMRRLRLASMAQCHDYFGAQDWLREISPPVEFPAKSRYDLRFFESFCK